MGGGRALLADTTPGGDTHPTATATRTSTAEDVAVLCVRYCCFCLLRWKAVAPGEPPSPNHRGRRGSVSSPYSDRRSRYNSRASVAVSEVVNVAEGGVVAFSAPGWKRPPTHLTEPTDYAYLTQSGYQGMVLHLLSPILAEYAYPWLASRRVIRVICYLTPVLHLLATLPLFSTHIFPGILWVSVVFIVLMLHRATLYDWRIWRLLVREFETWFMLANWMMALYISQSNMFTSPAARAYAICTLLHIPTYLCQDAIRLPVDIKLREGAGAALVTLTWIGLNTFQKAAHTDFQAVFPGTNVPVTSVFIAAYANILCYWIKYCFTSWSHPDLYVALTRPMVVRKLVQAQVAGQPTGISKSVSVKIHPTLMAVPAPKDDTHDEQQASPHARTPPPPPPAASSAVIMGIPPVSTPGAAVVTSSVMPSASVMSTPKPSMAASALHLSPPSSSSTAVSASQATSSSSSSSMTPSAVDLPSPSSTVSPEEPSSSSLAPPEAGASPSSLVPPQQRPPPSPSTMSPPSAQSDVTSASSLVAPATVPAQEPPSSSPPPQQLSPPSSPTTMSPPEADSDGIPAQSLVAPIPPSASPAMAPPHAEASQEEPASLSSSPPPSCSSTMAPPPAPPDVTPPRSSVAAASASPSMAPPHAEASPSPSLPPEEPSSSSSSLPSSSSTVSPPEAEPPPQAHVTRPRSSVASTTIASASPSLASPLAASSPLPSSSPPHADTHTHDNTRTCAHTPVAAALLAPPPRSLPPILTSTSSSSASPTASSYPLRQSPPSSPSALLPPVTPRMSPSTHRIREEKASLPPMQKQITFREAPMTHPVPCGVETHTHVCVSGDMHTHTCVRVESPIHAHAHSEAHTHTHTDDMNTEGVAQPKAKLQAAHTPTDVQVCKDAQCDATRAQIQIDTRGRLNATAATARMSRRSVRTRRHRHLVLDRLLPEHAADRALSLLAHTRTQATFAVLLVSVEIPQFLPFLTLSVPLSLVQISWLFYLPAVYRLMLMDTWACNKLLEMFEVWYLVVNGALQLAGLFVLTTRRPAMFSWFNVALSGADIFFLDALMLSSWFKVVVMCVFGGNCLVALGSVTAQKMHYADYSHQMGQAIPASSFVYWRMLTFAVFGLRNFVNLVWRPDVYLMIRQPLERSDKELLLVSTLRDRAVSLWRTTVIGMAKIQAKGRLNKRSQTSPRLAVQRQGTAP